jgi:CHAT domain-containing protein
MYFKSNLLIISIGAAIALQTCYSALASTPRSDCSTAATTLKLNPELCDGEFASNFKMILDKSNDSSQLRQLGISLRRLGFLDEAGIALERSLKIAPSISTRLSLANLSHAKYQQAINSTDRSTESVSSLEASDRSRNLARQTLDGYQSIISADPDQIQAYLNWTILWSSLKHDPDLAQLQLKTLPTAKTLISKLSSQLESLPATQQTDGRLTLADCMLEAIPLDQSFQPVALNNVNLALSQSQSNNNLRNISKAFGIIGKLNVLDGHSDRAIAAFNKASSAADSIRAVDLLYQWQWEVAKLYAEQGDRAEAQKLYQQAIRNIEGIRTDMLSLNTDVQYSFRDLIEPVYREYLELLLSSPKPDLTKVIATNEKLQVAELENYLKCGSLGIKSLLTLSPEQSPEAILSFIKMPNQYGIVVRSKKGDSHFRLVQRQPVDMLVRQIKIHLQSARFRESASSDQFRAISTSLYQQLIEPVTQYLPKTGHLAFSIDSNLQGIPWGLLYDGKGQYLMEKYSTSLSLGTELLPPKPLKARPSSLIAGATEFPKNPGYSPLPEVSNEIDTIASNLRGKKLFNQNFTNENLVRLGSRVQILHLATHGQFSSLARDTYILNWDGKFTLSNLEKLLKSRQNNPLELLVLSACQTAAGDRRATLGLAGAALQSGARSTVASLWVVEDESQTVLMQEFYTQLIQKRKSKGEALRLAQLKLLKSEKYSSPYFWSGTLLVGSWQ